MWILCCLCLVLCWLQVLKQARLEYFCVALRNQWNVCLKIPSLGMHTAGPQTVNMSWFQVSYMFGQIHLSCEICISYDYVELWSHLWIWKLTSSPPRVELYWRDRFLLFVFLFKLLLLCVWMFCLMSFGASHMCPVPMEASKGHPIP